VTGRRRVLTAVVLVALLPLMTAFSCDFNSKQAQKWNDAPTTGSPNEDPAKIYAMPDGFSNVAIKCIKGTHSGIATAFHQDSPYASITVFQNAEICP
jgi:hypothetical protein